MPPTSTPALPLSPEHLHDSQHGRRAPGEEGRRAKGHVGLGRVADVAAAEEQALQEDGERDEAREVEEGVCDFEGGC